VGELSSRHEMASSIGDAKSGDQPPRPPRTTSMMAVRNARVSSLPPSSLSGSTTSARCWSSTTAAAAASSATCTKRDTKPSAGSGAAHSAASRLCAPAEATATGRGRGKGPHTWPSCCSSKRPNDAPMEALCQLPPCLVTVPPVAAVAVAVAAAAAAAAATAPRPASRHAWPNLR